MGKSSRCDLNESSYVLTEPATTDANNDNRSRLSQAIEDLSAAYAQQVRVVRDFQKQNSELAAAISRLDESCRQYQQVVAKLSVTPLRRKAMRLARLAELAQA